LLLFLEKEGLALLSMGQPPGRLVLVPRQAFTAERGPKQIRVFCFFFAKKKCFSTWLPAAQTEP
jgi:hypothetical protein